ncbi:MBOAT family O-acyltransferase [Leptothoe kymatousa]|nr:MBOAT family O-acyltransferase [Leptothoe kymatousa]
MGISFYTFQSISCCVDVYRKEFQSNDYSFIDYALYISFFPQLVAGPIMRASELFPQFHRKASFSYSTAIEGISRICWGLSKKVLIADPLSNVVSTVYANYTQQSGLSLLIATYAFAVQIYLDFSGYCDVAIGAAKLIGFNLDENFSRPYLSKSIREFWRRWHITLSTWLRDYIYIPLGGSRAGDIRTCLNLMVTMFLGGLWHGASYNFVIWGGLQGLFLVSERLFEKTIFKAHASSNYFFTILKWLFTFHLICFSWIFFRAENYIQATTIIGRILTNKPGLQTTFVPLIILITLLSYQILDNPLGFSKLGLRFPLISRWLIYVNIILISIAISGASNPEFIYFQF